MNPMNQQSWSIYLVICGAFAAACLMNVDSTWAQSPASRRNSFGADSRNRPTVSPYLSMQDNGSGYGAMNYYNIVRPQQRARQAARNLRNELRDVESEMGRPNGNPNTTASKQAAPITTGRMQPTGHSTAFADTKNYF